MKKAVLIATIFCQPFLATVQESDDAAARGAVGVILQDTTLRQHHHSWLRIDENRGLLIVPVRNFIYQYSTGETRVEIRTMTSKEQRTCPTTPPVAEILSREFPPLLDQQNMKSPSDRAKETWAEVIGSLDERVHPILLLLNLAQFLVDRQERADIKKASDRYEATINGTAFQAEMQRDLPELEQDFRVLSTETESALEQERAGLANRRDPPRVGETDRLKYVEGLHSRTHAMAIGSPSCIEGGPSHP